MISLAIDVSLAGTGIDSAWELYLDLPVSDNLKPPDLGKLGVTGWMARQLVSWSCRLSFHSSWIHSFQVSTVPNQYVYQQSHLVFVYTSLFIYVNMGLGIPSTSVSFSSETTIFMLSDPPFAGRKYPFWIEIGCSLALGLPSVS